MWAAIYPGQGSQQVGMGKFLFENFKEAKHLFEEASDTLSIDFKKLCFDGPESDLALTENTQPALLLVSTATHQVLQATSDFKPQAACGHSIGEYAAVVGSGALKFSDALKAVRKRGEFMQSAVPVGTGAMAAVMNLSPEQVQTVCIKATQESKAGVVEPANFNTPGQIVISGSKGAVDWLMQHFDPSWTPGANRVKFIPLNVSAPFHCSLMKPAEEKMQKVLNDLPFQKASYPVVQNVNAKAETEGSNIRNNLVLQISRPVRWIECVMELKKMGHTKLIELGAGKVASGLVKKIDSETLSTFTINSLEDLKTVELAIANKG